MLDLELWGGSKPSSAENAMGGCRPQLCIALTKSLCTELCSVIMCTEWLSSSPQAFFTDRYLQEHPEAHGQIEKLKDLIAWQVGCPVTALHT